MGKIIGLIFKSPVPDTEKYICPVCGKEYKTEEGLQRHMQDKHPEDNPPESEEPQE